jgi:hypothetical protein
MPLDRPITSSSYCPHTPNLDFSIQISRPPTCKVIALSTQDFSSINHCHRLLLILYSEREGQRKKHASREFCGHNPNEKHGTLCRNCPSCQYTLCVDRTSLIHHRRSNYSPTPSIFVFETYNLHFPTCHRNTFRGETTAEISSASSCHWLIGILSFTTTGLKC